MSGLPKEYLGMMRAAVNADKETEQERPLKRRKKKTQSRDSPTPTTKREPATTPHVNFSIAPDEEGSSSASWKPKDIRNVDTIDLTSDTEQDLTDHYNKKSITPDTPQRIVVDLNISQKTPDPLPHNPFNTKEVEDDGDDSDDDFDDFEFEDVDLENVQQRASSMLMQDVVVAVDKPDIIEKRPKKTRLNIISKEERDYRRTFHRNYLASMMIHGYLRNQWCNDTGLQDHLKKLITVKIYDELHPSSSLKIDQMKTRSFLDGLIHLMEKWAKYYKVTSNKGIYKHDWYDWESLDRPATNFERFKRCIERRRGTRDIGAQGFVTLLRAADVPSRLVFSLQPPDFTNRQIKNRKPQIEPEPKPELTVLEKLVSLRKGKTASPKKPQATQAEIEMAYPVFWAEAWDSSSKKWITIDPIMMKTIEDVKYKSKLEPPLSYPYNSLTYVIGYDKRNGVRDITRRYAEKYYSKTRKKRITKDESEDIWYSGLLSSLNSRPMNKADQFEDEYFAKRAEQEGMPDNIQDFKGHPFYCLESQLKANEIIHPKESCGMLRIKGRNEAVKVYKRANVQYLRSPRAWYQRGRVLKIGMKPLKTRQKTSFQISRNLAFDDDDEDKEERLYAEFQTEVYVPPPALDGLIEKNTYGNIDVFVPSMIPEGAVLIDTPHAEDAAKVLGIDYAPAVVGFKFDRRQATPKIGGVVVGADFKEAMQVIQEQLTAEAAEKERMALDIRAMKGWNLLLTKLRIKQRLDKSHGKITEDVAVDSEEEYERMQREFDEFVANDDDDDDDDDDDESEEEHNTNEPQDFGAGFLAEDGVWDGEGNKFNDDEENEEVHAGADTGAGFFTEETTYHTDPGAGFLVEDSEEQVEPEDSWKTTYENEADTGAGFLIEEDEDEPVEPSPGENDHGEYEAFMNDLGDGSEDEYEDGEEDNQEDQEEAFQDEVSQQAQAITRRDSTVLEDQGEDFDSDELLEYEEKVTELRDDLEQIVREPGVASVDSSITSEQDADSKAEPESVTIKDNSVNDSKAQVKEVPSPPSSSELPESEFKELSQDDELEKQFNEQMERERESTPVVEDSVGSAVGDIDDDDDDDFEYYSD